MNSTPKSFRLSKNAQELLAQLADDFSISQNKVVEILLTEEHHTDGGGFIHPKAENILIEYFAKKANRGDSR